MHSKLQETISPVQTALVLLSRQKKRALLHESVLQEQARACHEEAVSIEQLEYQLQKSQDVELAKDIIKSAQG